MSHESFLKEKLTFSSSCDCNLMRCVSYALNFGSASSINVNGTRLWETLIFPTYITCEKRMIWIVHLEYVVFGSLKLPQRIESYWVKCPAWLNCYCCCWSMEFYCCLCLNYCYCPCSFSNHANNCAMWPILHVSKLLMGYHHVVHSVLILKIWDSMQVLNGRRVHVRPSEVFVNRRYSMMFDHRQWMWMELNRLIRLMVVANLASDASNYWSGGGKWMWLKNENRNRCGLCFNKRRLVWTIEKKRSGCIANQQQTKIPSRCKKTANEQTVLLKCS